MINDKELSALALALSDARAALTAAEADWTRYASRAPEDRARDGERGAELIKALCEASARVATAHVALYDAEGVNPMMLKFLLGGGH